MAGIEEEGSNTVVETVLVLARLAIQLEDEGGTRGRSKTIEVTHCVQGGCNIPVVLKDDRKCMITIVYTNVLKDSLSISVYTMVHKRVVASLTILAYVKIKMDCIEIA